MFVLLSAPEYNLAWVGSLGTLCLLCLVNWGFWLHHAGVCSWWNLRIGGKPWRDHYSADLGRLYAKPPEKRLYYKIFYGLFRVGCLTPSFFLSFFVLFWIHIHSSELCYHSCHINCSSTFLWVYLISFIIYFITGLPLLMYRYSGKKAYPASRATWHRTVSMRFSWTLVSSRHEYSCFLFLFCFPLYFILFFFVGRYSSIYL